MARGSANVKRFTGGLRYVSLGGGRRPLVVFDGLWLDDKPQHLTARMYRFLGDAYTVYVVARRQGMPHGYSLADMASDYADMVTEEFAAPVDVVGVSTGASVALHFAADHPNLVRRLVLHSGACRLSDEARRSQQESARLAGLGQWREALAQLMSPALPRSGPFRVPAQLLVGLATRLMTVRPPRDASDYGATCGHSCSSNPASHRG